MMIRAEMGGPAYWAERKADKTKWMVETRSVIDAPPVNTLFSAEYRLHYARGVTNFALKLYSMGESIEKLRPLLPLTLDGWELSNDQVEQIRRQTGNPGLRGWTFELSNLDHYIWCFWLLGFALIFDVPDDEWRRLVVLIGEEGHDRLIDRLIASRDPNRRIGKRLLHPVPYARLLSAIDAAPADRPRRLRQFVEHWYEGLDRPGDEAPYWYHFGDPVLHPLSLGSYSGRWCIEAAAAAKVFGIDDSLCLGHEHYPGDLLRPDGPTTHPVRHDLVAEPPRGIVQSWLRRLKALVKQAA